MIHHSLDRHCKRKRAEKGGTERYRAGVRGREEQSGSKKKRGRERGSKRKRGRERGSKRKREKRARARGREKESLFSARIIEATSFEEGKGKAEEGRSNTRQTQCHVVCSLLG